MEKKSGFVSVIIPFYNSLDYARKAFNLLRKQTLASFEVIFVDDGSKEDGMVEFEDLLSRDGRFRMLHQRHCGAGEARNAGLRIARGDYVLFLDCDDFFHEELLEELRNSALRDNADVVLCDASMEEDESFHALSSSLPSCSCLDPKNIKEKLFQISVPAPWNKLIRMSLIKEHRIQFLPLSSSNDLTFTYTAMSVAKRISFVRRKLIRYTSSNPNSIQKNKENSPTNIVTALDGLLENLIRLGKLKEFTSTFLKLKH